MLDDENVPWEDLWICPWESVLDTPGAPEKLVEAWIETALEEGEPPLGRSGGCPGSPLLDDLTRLAAAERELRADLTSALPHTKSRARRARYVAEWFVEPGGFLCSQCDAYVDWAYTMEDADWDPINGCESFCHNCANARGIPAQARPSSIAEALSDIANDRRNLIDSWEHPGGERNLGEGSN